MTKTETVLSGLLGLLFILTAILGYSYIYERAYSQGRQDEIKGIRLYADQQNIKLPDYIGFCRPSFGE